MFCLKMSARFFPCCRLNSSDSSSVQSYSNHHLDESVQRDEQVFFDRVAIQPDMISLHDNFSEFNNSLHNIIADFQLTSDDLSSSSIKINLSRRHITSKMLEDFLKLCITYNIAEKIINLDLSKNKLTELPVKIGKLTSLRILCLSNNQLQSVPTAIKKPNIFNST